MARFLTLYLSALMTVLRIAATGQVHPHDASNITSTGTLVFNWQSCPHPPAALASGTRSLEVSQSSSLKAAHLESKHLLRKETGNSSPNALNSSAAGAVDSMGAAVDSAMTAWKVMTAADGCLEQVIRAAALDAAQVEYVTRSLLKTFRPCATCSSYARFGEPNDGGYVMCNDDLDVVHPPLMAAYSYGINGFDGWGNGISKKYKIPVFEYDCTNPARPTPCDGCDLRFHLICLAAEGMASGAYHSLSQQMAANGHIGLPAGSLVGKIDIEGAEWPMFVSEPVRILRKFRTLVVEFHQLSQKAYHQQYFNAMKHILNSGFNVLHIHGNNNGNTATFGWYTIPNVIEVTFVQRLTRAGQACSSTEVRSPLDAPNANGRPELPRARLPSFASKRLQRPAV